MIERRHLDRVARRLRRQIGRSGASMPRNRRAPTAAVLGRCDRFVPDRDDEFDRIRSVFDPPDARVTFVDGVGRMMLLSAAIDVAAGTLERRP